ncbi:MAG: transposase [Pirellulales bacterium]|nr:transposase [Pirellulales bacterium]
MDANVLDRPQELAKEIAGQATTIEDLNGVMKALMKSALEQMLGAEFGVHLNEERPAVDERGPSVAESPTGRRRNRRNGTSPKSVQGDLGKIELDVPRDREEAFEPQLVPKHQRRLAGFDEKILALYVKGMMTRDIQKIVKGRRGAMSGRR